MARVMFTIVLALLLTACGAPNVSVVPTSTVEVTAAPVSTDAPSPQATLALDGLPNPALSDQANAYLADASNLLQTYDEWITTLETQSAAARQDPGLVRDEQWKRDGVVALVALRIAAARLGRLDAGGSEAQPLADLATRIGGETEPMAAQWSAGLDEADATKIATASTLLQKIRLWLDEARMELIKLQSQ